MKFYETEEEIERWLLEYKVSNFLLIKNEEYGFVVDAWDDVDLSSKELDFIPIKFNSISGNFRFDNNKITDLEFCPNYVGGNFYCDKNKLTTLKGCPRNFGHLSIFDCSNNLLTNLIGAPREIGSFFCNNNKLISLRGSPNKIYDKFDCSYNKLKNFKGFSNKTLNLFNGCNNELENLIWLPKSPSIYLIGNKKINNHETGNKYQDFVKQHKEEKECYKKEKQYLFINKAINDNEGSVKKVNKI